MSKVWVCVVCTLENDLHDDKCTVCLSPMKILGSETWSCGKCTYENGCNDDNCIMCGNTNKFPAPAVLEKENLKENVNKDNINFSSWRKEVAMKQHTHNNSTHTTGAVGNIGAIAEVVVVNKNASEDVVRKVNRLVDSRNSTLTEENNAPGDRRYYETGTSETEEEENSFINVHRTADEGGGRIYNLLDSSCSGEDEEQEEEEQVYEESDSDQCSTSSSGCEVIDADEYYAPIAAAQLAERGSLPTLKDFKDLDPSVYRGGNSSSAYSGILNGYNVASPQCSFPRISAHYWSVKTLSAAGQRGCAVNFDDFTLDKGRTNINSATHRRSSASAAATSDETNYEARRNKRSLSESKKKKRRPEYSSKKGASEKKRKLPKFKFRKKK